MMGRVPPAIVGRAIPGAPQRHVGSLVPDRCAMPLDLITRLDPLRRIRCPFCFERFAACEMHLRCDNHYCKADFAHMVEDPILSRALNGPRAATGATSTLRGPWWVDPRGDPRRGPRRHLDWMLLPAALA